MMDKDTEYFTVSQVTELVGVTAAQLKNWDKTGVLVARRTGDGVANNRKLYDKGDVEKAREILLYRSLGFGLEEIKQVLDASPEERAQLVSKRANKLKSDYSNIQKQIELTSALEVFTPEALLSELDCDDVSSASDEYSKDENIRMMVRWMRSHTEQDAERFKQQLSDALEGFSELDPDAPWEEVERQLLCFCDVWSNSFGWPTVGQMLSFALIFQEMADGPDASELSGLFDADACIRLSEIFYLAWADNALRVLDGILACAYCRAIEESDVVTLRELGPLLCTFACEAGNRPHLYRGETPIEHPVELERIIDFVFDQLEKVILDMELGEYLDIDQLLTIDQESMDRMHEFAKAFAGDNEGAWIRANGFARLVECLSQWYDMLQDYWKLDQAKQDGDNAQAAFVAWLVEYYAPVLEDPPMTRWITEEEAIAHEKKMRALVQEMVARQDAAEGAILEADE